MFGRLGYFAYLYEVKRERVRENPQSSSTLKLKHLKHNQL